MKKKIEVWNEYRRFHGQKAIDKFFKTHPDLEYWKEVFEWMLANRVDFYCDNKFADGSENKDWNYALHFDDDDSFTYICVIERA